MFCNKKTGEVVDPFYDLYHELTVELGDEDRLNRLILLERNRNQKHWAKEIEKLTNRMVNEYKEIK